MSKSVDKNKIEKQELLKQIIRELHAGVPAAKLQRKFRNVIKSTSSEEIADMENALIKEGFPPEEIQKLCDVHAHVFEKSISNVGRLSKLPGHPIYTFIQENKESKKIIKRLSIMAKKMKKSEAKEPESEEIKKEFNRLKEIEKHYLRKENQLFPALEAKDFIGPSKVMWGKHDEIREHLKKAESFLKDSMWEDFYRQFKTLSSAIRKMIFLEEKILYPTAARKLSTPEWINIKQGEKDIGYAWIAPSNLWDAELARTREEDQIKTFPEPVEEYDKIKLDQGYLTQEQLTLLLKKLPVEITFVDENGKVCFYSAHEDRIFPRSPAVIGREVQNCHPHKSVHIVNEILQSFIEKKKDVAEFWIQRHGQFIHIQYFPLYGEKGQYKGVIEVTQEVSRIRALQGERRILDW